MAVNRGKKFEEHIREAFERVPNVSIDRIPDQTNFYKGSQNICDFMVYREPYLLYIECKSVHGNTLPFSNITDTQWKGLSRKSNIKGVYAGVLCWWVDHDVTRFIPILVLELLKHGGAKSIRYDYDSYSIFDIRGKKKRTFFDYYMEEFLDEISDS